MMSFLTHAPKPCLRDRQETPIEIRREGRSDTAAREWLLDVAFGASRFAKTSERLREGRVPADGLAFVAPAYYRRTSQRCVQRSPPRGLSRDRSMADLPPVPGAGLRPDTRHGSFICTPMNLALEHHSMITCYLRYQVDPDKLSEFEAYGASTARTPAPIQTLRRRSPSQKRRAASSAMNGRFSGRCFRKRLSARFRNHATGPNGSENLGFRIAAGCHLKTML
jgi:hypothetical protein